MLMPLRLLALFALTLTGCAMPHSHTQSTSSMPSNDPFAGMKHDPQEDNPRLRDAFRAADAYAHRRTANDPPRMGGIYTYWRFKKEFLLREYGIHWKDPAELNPNIAID
jgi:hypothetical protein